MAACCYWLALCQWAWSLNWSAHCFFFFSSSVKYPAMGVALYRWGVMAQSNSSSDSPSLGEES